MSLTYESFATVDLSDAFFDSLKQDYNEFPAWFLKKSQDYAYVFRKSTGALDGFLYLKLEEGELVDATPPLPAAKRLKIGTFKINPHGTRLGERFMKKVFDHAVSQDVDQIYVTIFAKHAALVDLFRRYGFVEAGHKTTKNGEELVLVRDLHKASGDIVADYPLVHTRQRQSALLSIYPEWHTRLFPDSKLKNESPDIVKDVSHTNSIHKVYLCAMEGVLTLKRGDILLIYRTKGSGSAPAHYTSVVTSVCVLEESRSLFSFSSMSEFLAYAQPYSVFTDQELAQMWAQKRYPNVLRFTYNVAFSHRVTRAELIEVVGLPGNAYYGFLPVTNFQLKHILQLGKVHAGLIVD